MDETVDDIFEGTTMPFVVELEVIGAEERVDASLAEWCGVVVAEDAGTEDCAGFALDMLAG